MVETPEKFEKWAIVELMGHAHIAGLVTQETLFGTVLMRVDVPAIDEKAAFTKYFGGSSIYSIAPCDEATVLRYIKAHSPRPISIFIPQAQPALTSANPESWRTESSDYPDNYDDEDFAGNADEDAPLDDGTELSDAYIADADAARSDLEEAAPSTTGDTAETGENPLSLYEDAQPEENSANSDEPVSMDELEIVHVIRIERQNTKGTNSPSWQMETVQGKRFHVFEHKLEDRNTWTFFRDAGYGIFLQNMKLGEVQRWQKHPIEATVYKKNGFYVPKLVIERNALAEPDTLFNFWPERRINVVKKAQAIKKGILVDVEATGTSASDEVTEIHFQNCETGEFFTTLIKPTDVNMVNVPSVSGKKPSDVNGITVTMLKDAPSIKEIAEQIYLWTENVTLIGHNVEFDIRLINQSLKAVGLEPISPKDSICTMQDLMSPFVGDPFGDGERFRWISLEDSAKFLGIMPDTVHRAAGDARTAGKVIKGLASLEPAEKPDDDYPSILKRLPF